MCNKCKMLKSIEEFASYVHKKTGNLYTRHICKECFNEGTRAYKKSIKPRECIECNEIKLGKDFPNYKSLTPNDKRHKICKKCTARLYREKGINRKREENGETVHWRPNTYNSEQQRQDGFQLMEALGFTFVPETGRWHKEGFKNPDGTFVRIEEKKRLQKERVLKEVEELDVWSKMRYLREVKGYSLNKIAEEIGVNHTAIYKFFQNGQKVKLRDRFE